MTPRQKEQQERIFSVVKESVSTSGYEGVTMREIAKAAGVATATLYNQYSSKDDLVMAVFRDSIFKVSGFNRSEFDDPVQYFFARTRAIYADLVKNPNFARAMLKVFFNAPPEAEIVEIITKIRLKADEMIVEELAGSGLLLPGIDKKSAAMRLTANSLSGLLYWVKGFLPTDEVPEYIRERDVEVFEAILNIEGRKLLP